MTSTALGYQMMYEGALLQASIECMKVGKYWDACELAKACAVFMGVEELPTMPVREISRDGDQEARKYYFRILTTLARTGNQILINVRKDYKSDIPR
jgi:hypothetical protein